MIELASGNRAALEALCRQYGIHILYAFGSRGKQAYNWLAETGTTLPPGASQQPVRA